MRKFLPRFWNALDEIPNATTDRREWLHRLGEEWSVCEPYLKSTGRLVREVACPSPGGDGCPRKVVRHGDGRFRATCGCTPAECDSVDLTRQDIVCLALNFVRFAALVRRIFDASERLCSAAGVDGSMIVGSHEVAAGAYIPILFLIPGPTATVSTDALSARGIHAAAIVVPTTRSLPAEARSAFAGGGHLVFCLSEILTLNDDRLAAFRAAVELLAPLRERLLASLTHKAPGRLWVLPGGTRWEDLTFDFVAEEVVNVQYRSESRRFEPEHFGLKSEKSGRPKSGWVLLRSIARQGGGLTWNDRKASSRIKKQKQLLSARLRSLFGIEADPLPARGSGYEALFTIRDSTLSDVPARRR